MQEEEQLLDDESPKQTAEDGEFAIEEDKLSVASEELGVDIREKLASISDDVMQDMTGVRKLALWYAYLPSIKADVIDELGGNDSCLISAEGLILRFAAGLEYQGLFTESPQFLKIQYMIEKFLSQLIEVGVVNFTLIFFDCLKGLLLSQHASLWAFRQAFRMYCGLNQSILTFKHFQSWTDPAYSAFIDQRYPFVFLMEDGSALEVPRSILLDEEDAPAHVYAPLYALMLDTVVRGVSVAAMYKIARAGRRMKAFVVLPTCAIPELAAETRAEIETLMIEGSETLDPVEPTVCQFNLEEWGKLNVPFRLALFASCAKENLHEEEVCEGWSALLFKSLILHDFVLRTTRLQDRPVSLSKVECETYHHSIEFLMALICHYLTATLNTLDESNYHNFTDQGVELIDLIDEKILRTILFAIYDEGKSASQIEADFFGIPETFIGLLDKVWSYVRPGESFFPIVIDDLMDEKEGFLATEFAPETLILDEEESETTAGSDSSPCGSSDSLKPEVLPVIRNDYLIQMLKGKADARGIVSQVMRPSAEEPTLLNDFMRSELIGDDQRQLNCAEPPEPIRKRVWIEGDFDYATNHVEINTKSVEVRVPKWIEQKSGDQKLRALKRWQLKREQDNRLYARNINKYFGGLDRLHLPIVLVNGRAATDHPWLEEKKLTNKEATKDAKKVSNKAAAIIAKNKEKQAEKQSKKEDEKSASLYSQMNHLFKKKTQRPAIFCEELLQMLVGNRNAADATVLEEFSEMKRILTMPENQCKFLTTVAEKMMDPLEHTWRRRQILAAGQLGEILTLIGLIFRFIQITVDDHVANMTVTEICVFQTLLIMLGFVRSANETFRLWANHQWAIKSAGDKKMDADKMEKQKASYMKKLAQSGSVGQVIRKFDFAINPEIEATFQVKYLGADMERTLGSISDPRVGFRPDAWQKRLLDCVDSQQSCLVVAPTSSGKTYAGYYAMDKGLRFDNECCVLFVSPTRALALQVEAEVVARFSGKGYPSGCKTVLCGHLLEDRQDNWDHCQILITVPGCLEAVLSSTSPVMQKWSSRLKYAILDEIHCIGEEKAGKEWENLIQLLPCPFIALSATVGNEVDFSSWLQKAQSIVPPRPVQFIRHDERYADLRTLYYASQTRGLYELNPLLCLDFERIKSGSLTSDFDLIPTDTFEAYQEISAALNTKINSKILTEDQVKECNFFIQEFNPEKFFVGTRAITKKQYRRFLHSVLTSIEKFAVSNVINNEDINLLIDRIASKKALSASELEPWWVDHDTKKVEPKATPFLRDVLKTSGQANQSFNDPSEFLALIRDLEERKLMPALVFNFNRAFASRLFYRVAHKLIDEHRAKFYGTPEATMKTKMINKKRQDEYKATLARREMAEKWKSLSKEQREEQGIDEQLFAELTGPTPPPPTDVAEEHDPEFFLCDRRMFISQREEFDGVLEMCKLERYVKSGRVPELLLESLRRGIGLYHDALHREYRRAVELLFRMRYLRIVVSDAALSLGINMPCKSTVFAGDSAMLTPLLYRQTSGRAGRRGFDSLGHVVFWEFPFKKIRRLLCNKLAVLSGGYPVRPTSVLRAMNLSNNLEAECLREFALKCPTATDIDARTLAAIDIARCKLQKMFNVPLFAVGAGKKVRENLITNTQMSYRYSIDLLRRLDLLDNLGRAEGFATMAMALHDDEPGNLFLIYALMKGVLRDRQITYQAEEQDTAVDVDALLLHLLSFAMKRRDCTYSVVERFNLAAAEQRLQSILFPDIGMSLLEGPNCSPLLPPLPQHVQQTAERFDRLLFDNAIARAKSICLSRLELTEAEKQLPISMVMFDEPEMKGTDTAPFNKWRRKAKTPLKHTFYQSPFAAVSGLMDSELKSVPELIVHCRDAVYIEQGLVPQLMADTATVYIPDAKQRITLPLVNSYAADLLATGKLRSVIEANDIPASEAYFVLQALNGALGRLSAVLEANTSVSASEYVKAQTGAGTALELVSAISTRFSEIYSRVRGSA